MSCYSQGSQIIIVPGGCLDHREIHLQCKSPQERVTYQFSLANRLAPNDFIVDVTAWPSDEQVGIDAFHVNGQTFSARISGGTLNTKSGIRFLVTTKSNEVREFDVTLPVAPAGIVEKGPCGEYVIGDTGPMGPQGRAATVEVGKVFPTFPGGDPMVINQGTASDAVLDFVLPRGDRGPQGPQGDTGPTGPQGEPGEQGEQGKAGTQILLSNRDPVLADAKENTLWLNDVTGDWFETVPAGDDRFHWIKTGNLKGEAGSVIYTGTTDPVYNAIYKANDLYFNSTTSVLFTYGEKQWLKLSCLKGEQGTRGSLWFFGQEDPVVSKNAQEGDGYVNTNSYDVFVFNGSNWQKIGNIKGKQGDKGATGDTGAQGPQGQTGAKGDDGSRWYVGSTIPDATTGQDDPRGKPRAGDQYLYMNATTNEADAYIYSNTGAWLGPLGEVSGPQGKAATITVVDKVIPLDAGTAPSVSNLGSENDAIFQFSLPKGDTGATGAAGKDGADGSKIYSGSSDPQPSSLYRLADLWINSTTFDVFTFNGTTWQKIGNSKGDAATVTVGKTTTGDAGTDASVTNSGTSSAAVFDFTIPKGAKGDTGAAGEAGAKGDTGAAGKDGAAATIAVGKTTTGDAGTDAAVANSGTSNAATFDFTIPKGDKGDKGDTGAAGTSYVNDGTVALDVATITSDGGKVKTDGLGNVTCNSLKTTTDFITNTIECQTLTATNNFNIYKLHSLYGGNPTALGGGESCILVNNVTVCPSDADPTSTKLRRGFYLTSDGDFYITNNYVPVTVTDTTSSSANASLVDYDYVLSVDKDTKLAAIKNIKTNTQTACAYYLIDNSGIPTTSIPIGVLAYNKTTNLPTVWNGIKWVDLTAAVSSLSYVEADQKANVDTKTLKVGAQSYDTTAKKPCWWNGTEWTDAMGNQLA